MTPAVAFAVASLTNANVELQLQYCVRSNSLALSRQVERRPTEDEALTDLAMRLKCKAFGFDWKPNTRYSETSVLNFNLDTTTYWSNALRKFDEWRATAKKEKIQDVRKEIAAFTNDQVKPFEKKVIFSFWADEKSTCVLSVSEGFVNNLVSPDETIFTESDVSCLSRLIPAA